MWDFFKALLLIVGIISSVYLLCLCVSVIASKVVEFFHSLDHVKRMLKYQKEQIAKINKDINRINKKIEFINSEITNLSDYIDDRL